MTAIDLGNGLLRTVLRQGFGTSTSAGASVGVYYSGYLNNGTVFDSNATGSNGLFSFSLGTGQVIAGWDLGLQDLALGSLVQLQIPANLAYGSRAIGSIPANSELRFIVEILRVIPAGTTNPIYAGLPELSQISSGQNKILLSILNLTGAFQRGTDSAESLLGTANGDLFIGAAGNDILESLAGDDLLIAGSGSDQLDGGEGKDIAIYIGNRSSYSILGDGQGSFIINGQNKQDTIKGIERILFADGLYSLSSTGELSLQAPTGVTALQWEAYIDRYPLTLGNTYETLIKPTGQTKSAYAEQHYLNYGADEGRLLLQSDPSDDLNDYGAYVENYGTTLLDIYRKDTRAIINGGSMSMFAWGKEHYSNWGKLEGRQLSGGVDWGAIVRNSPDLYNQWQTSFASNPGLSAFAYGFQNQGQIALVNGISIGTDANDSLTGLIAFGLAGNDSLVATSAGSILSGGFGQDIILAANGGIDTVYGGPGDDLFQLNLGTTLNIRDFRKGADMIQLGNGLSSSGVTLTYSSSDQSTYFNSGTALLAKVFGKVPGDFSYKEAANGSGLVYN